MAYDLDATTGAVRAGMDVLVWQVEDEHWHELGTTSANADHRKAHARAIGGVACVATIPIVAPLAFWLWDTGPATVYGFLINVALMPVAFLGAYNAVLGATRHAVGPHLPVIPMPPRVVLTTTGIIVGGHAWLWRSERYRLERAELRGDQPTKLCLTFRGTGMWRWPVSERITIPFPSELDPDLNELTELLDIKTRLAN